jgi:hypothetical protein
MTVKLHHYLNLPSEVISDHRPHRHGGEGDTSSAWLDRFGGSRCYQRTRFILLCPPLGYHFVPTKLARPRVVSNNRKDVRSRTCDYSGFVRSGLRDYCFSYSESRKYEKTRRVDFDLERMLAHVTAKPSSSITYSLPCRFPQTLETQKGDAIRRNANSLVNSVHY